MARAAAIREILPKNIVLAPMTKHKIERENRTEKAQEEMLPKKKTQCAMPCLKKTVGTAAPAVRTTAKFLR